MLASLLLIANVTFAESKALLVQIGLDRVGLSCNTIDGNWGAKSARAFRHSQAGAKAPADVTPEEIYEQHYKNLGNPYRWETVMQADLEALVKIPASPADKAQLERMGYESIAEMFAERGHLSRRALERLNPKVTNWSRVPVGTRIRIPDFPSMEDDLRAWPRDRSSDPERPIAALVKVSLGRFEVTAYDAAGKLLAAFPCSIAQNKAKLPPHGELTVTTTVASPNYTYTPDPDANGRVGSRHIWPPGPNCPVGIAWIGLSLPGYGIHGTPRPESIGNAESHGCFRLSNWNAARLYALVKPGTRVLIEK